MKALKTASDKIIGSLIFIGIGLLIFWVFGLGKSAINLWGWKQFSSAEGRFSVEFSKAPDEKRLSGRMKNDSRFTDAILFVAQSGNTAYSAGYGDDFDDTVSQFSVAQRLDAATEGAVINAQGTMRIIFEKNIFKNGFPGREIDLQGDGIDCRIRVYLVNSRRYTLGVVGRNIRFAKTTERFLDSFEITRN